jgi:molybdopterin-guanine dinucleotide biosynthesis protein
VPLVADSDWDVEDAETDSTETAEGGAESAVFDEDEVTVCFNSLKFTFNVKSC